MHNDTDFLDKMAFLASQGASRAAENAVTREVKAGLYNGGLTEDFFRFDDTAFNSGGVIKKDISGAGIYFSKAHSTPGSRLRVTFNGGRTIRFFAPGSKVLANFDGFTVSRDGPDITQSTVINPGTCTFIILQNDTTAYEEAPNTEAIANPFPSPINGAVQKTWASDLGTNGLTTLSTQGISLVGVRKAIIYWASTDATAFTAGTWRVLFYDDTPLSNPVTSSGLEWRGSVNPEHNGNVLVGATSFCVVVTNLAPFGRLGVQNIGLTNGGSNSASVKIVGI